MVVLTEDIRMRMLLGQGVSGEHLYCFFDIPEEVKKNRGAFNQCQ